MRQNVEGGGRGRRQFRLVKEAALGKEGAPL